MDFIEQLLANPYAALFLVIGGGLLLGQINIKGVSLGSSGVLFTSLLAGHFGLTIPNAVGTLGLVLFVYCVGIGAGGRFFGALAREGSTLAKLSLLVVTVGAALAYGLALVFNIPADLAAGLFAGAMTSTPALAGATEALTQVGEGALVIGYGIAYPFGVAGVVIYIQLLPRLLKWDLSKEAREHSDPRDTANRVVKVLVEVTNPNLFGKRIHESALTNFPACQVSRVMRKGVLGPLNYDDRLEQGQKLLLVGRSKEIEFAIDYVGQRSDEAYVLDSENERRQLLVTSKSVAGKTIGAIDPLKNHGVTITRITRLGLTFVPDSETEIEASDLLTVVGLNEQLDAFASLIGHRSNAIDETDLLSLSLGLAVGIIIGLIPFGLGDKFQITLGLAGGPLLAGLLLGHFGRVGRLVGHIPRPTRMLLQELGLVLFLADAGLRGGGAFVETVQLYGFKLFFVGALLTILPSLIALPLALKLFGMNRLQALGGICGGMTSTPALGAITAKTDSQIPVVSYATAYPIALILMTVFAKILVSLLGGG